MLDAPTLGRGERLRRRAEQRPRKGHTWRACSERWRRPHRVAPGDQADQEEDEEDNE